MAAPTAPVISLEHVTLVYDQGTRALDDVSLSIAAGERVCVLGANGSGKSTLASVLCGLLAPDEGTVDLVGERVLDDGSVDLEAYRRARHGIGLVFQNPDDQIFRYNVLDEVMFGPLNIGMDEKTAREKSREALAMTGLAGLEDRNPYDLELYERKMVAIASVLAMDPDVLILDEPTIAQDVRGRRRIAEIVRTLSQRGKLVLAILHDMDFVAECFERVIVMAQGRVVAEGTPRRVFSDAEALQAARLDPPHVTQLCTRLGYEGVFLTVEEFLHACGRD